MKTFIIPVVILLHIASIQAEDLEENVRYILIEAPCKSGFKAFPEYKEKVILTKVFRVQFEHAFDLVNAEPQLIVDFEVALEKVYPDSRNHVKDIMVYMLNTEKEAKELYNRKLKQFKALETGIIELKIK